MTGGGWEGKKAEFAKGDEMQNWLILLGIIGLLFFLMRRGGGGMGCCGGGHSHGGPSEEKTKDSPKQLVAEGKEK
jgi:hypothetical protein